MRCRVPALALSWMALQPSPLHTSPVSRDLSTHLAPWSTIWPAPSALWPTSLFPMSASLGRPTAVPCALIRRQRPGALARSSSIAGVSAAWMALNLSWYSDSPQPSRTCVGSVGAGGVRWGSGLSGCKARLQWELVLSSEHDREPSGTVRLPCRTQEHHASSTHNTRNPNAPAATYADQYGLGRPGNGGVGLQLVRLQQGDVLLQMVGVALAMLFYTQGVRRGVCHDVWMFALYKEA
ncbi:hypothetical protein F751_5144 [Auxenochlorella protothecoides]|uniref:Uncharacterized protein n=1 Tax=Auxenochlorella protothecoides TaxID=3075 RepID=A0A087SEZ8_AUXPR|nr:hypothetical protein F751_5144 [Auxenochlorella protothecoides]KFM24302.1 hypothetical protein F751_5144 [Auxenochlorella protothecoides]